MRKKNKLNSIEKREQEILRVLLVFIFSIGFKGMYNESNNIDQNYILIPIFITVSFLFCLIYGVNAFSTGNIVKNWVNYQIFDSLANFIKIRKKVSDDKAITLTTKAFGIFMLSIAAFLLVAGIIFYFK